MTRHARVLDAIEPGSCIFIHPEELKRLHAVSGQLLVIASRRGRVAATARADEPMQKGVVMMPFSFNEAAANIITNEALDPYAKIPEFKYCAVSVGLSRRTEDRVAKTE